jgi:hypothetical protein
MTPPHALSLATPGYTPTELQALQLLRARYRHDQDRWSPQERARLAFARWLYATGRLQP